MSVKNTFILVAEDCPTFDGRVPPLKDGQPCEARLQYALLSQHPYEYDLNALNYAVHCLLADKNPTPSDRDEFLSRSHPCLRKSPLTQVYGWGVHYDWAGRIALYPANSVAYQRLCRDPALTVVRAWPQAKMLTHETGLNPGVRHVALQSVA